MCILCANLLEEITIDCTKLLLKDYKKSGKSTSSPRLTANSSSFLRLNFCTRSATIIIVFVFVFEIHDKLCSGPIQLICVCICICDQGKPLDGPICLHICHGRIIARCLCSCLSLANLHLPSSVCGLPTFVRRKRCLHNLYLLVIIRFLIMFAVWLKLKCVHFFSN